jgi:hypothetical protein
MSVRPELEAALAEVLAAREGLSGEVVRLEAAARAAVDIPARIRRAPAKAAGVAAGAAFFVLGGPGRVFHGVKRAVLGPAADLPRSMLPDEVEKELRKLGSDGKRVRATLERDFAKYLEDKADVRRERDLVGTVAFLAGNLLKPASAQAGKRLAERLFNPDSESFQAALERARRRAARRRDSKPADGSGSTS